ncbi:hypothetical protein MN116_007891 [Schistosoma mekongi]|uniref:UBC core domain-containing protein n=1 Tax=Schistosoma mekongi TaxID=38744 RepID=A0AAE1Z6W1_SCHME|nr:hypothetical protein MN116_007891 [Schistosoma mekongi]
MFIQGLHILSELSLLKLKHPSGVFVSPCETDPLRWLGIISVRSGYYFGGVFSFVLVLPDDFPSTKLPKLYLSKEFYHPQVDWVTGEVNMYTEFPVWNPNKHHIWHILHYFKRMLTSPTSIMVSALAEQTACIRNMRDVDYANPEAANALIHRPEEFDNQAKLCVTKLSVWTQSAQDIPSLNVSGWTSDSLLNGARNVLQNFEDSNNNEEKIISQGFSWIDPKNMSIFSSETAAKSDSLSGT